MRHLVFHSLRKHLKFVAVAALSLTGLAESGGCISLKEPPVPCDGAYDGERGPVPVTGSGACEGTVAVNTTHPACGAGSDTSTTSRLDCAASGLECVGMSELVYCRKTCVSNADCPAKQQCNLVTKTNDGKPTCTAGGTFGDFCDPGPNRNVCSEGTCQKTPATTSSRDAAVDDADSGGDGAQGDGGTTSDASRDDASGQDASSVDNGSSDSYTCR